MEKKLATNKVLWIFAIGQLGWSTLSGIISNWLAAIPMAILGVLPQAVVADIAEADATTSGEARQGMFYAARTFAFKLGQSISMLVFTGIAAMSLGGMQYRKPPSSPACSACSAA